MQGGDGIQETTRAAGMAGFWIGLMIGLAAGIVFGLVFEVADRADWVSPEIARFEQAHANHEGWMRAWATRDSIDAYIDSVRAKLGLAR